MSQPQRIKFHYRIIDQRAGADQPPLLAVSIHRGVVPRDTITDDLPRAEDLSNYKLCEPGDIVVNRMRAFQGAIGISPQRGIVSPDYLVLRPGLDVEARYLHHLFRSTWFVGEMISRLRGIGNTENGAVRTPRINAEDLGDIPVVLPAIDEQRRIADFLDAETGKIDELISKQYGMLELLGKRIDSQIIGYMGASRAVDRENGAPIVQIRRVLDKVIRPPLPDATVITAYRDGQVTSRESRRAEGYTLSATDTYGQGVLEDDVVVHGLDGFAGAIGTCEVPGNCSPVYHVCTPRGGGDPVFYGRLLRVLAMDGYLGPFAISVRERAFDFRNWDLFGSIPIPVVQTDEQRDIGERIRSARPFRNLADRFRDRLLERRQALITAAVTGQFDVTTGRGFDSPGGA